MVYGWSKLGLQKFNESAQQVKMDRISFADDFNNEFKSFMDEQERKKKKTKWKREEIKTYNDLNGSGKLHDENDNSLSFAEFDENDLLPIAEV